MTEAEWLSCSDVSVMLVFIRENLSLQKLQLYTTEIGKDAWISVGSKNRDDPDYLAYLDSKRMMAWVDRPFVLRDILGNPFRPVTTADPTWLTPTVVALADGIYQERAFNRLPVLADALEEAGCDSEDIRTHCRGPGPHVRGCWVVDLLTGRK